MTDELAPRRRQRPTLPLFSSGDPTLASQAIEMFGGDDTSLRPRPGETAEQTVDRVVYAINARQKLEAPRTDAMGAIILWALATLAFFWVPLIVLILHFT